MFLLTFLNVCVRIKLLLCNILPGLICIWKDVYEICAKTFLEGKFMCAKNFLCALVSRFVAHSLALEGALVHSILVYSAICITVRYHPSSTAQFIVLYCIQTFI